MPEFTDYIKVPNGYHYSCVNGIFSVMDKKFKNELDIFLQRHSEIQKAENYPYLPKEKLVDFPFIDFKPYHNELFSRKQDIHLLKKLLRNASTKGKTALEFGGWNAWLTNWLHTNKFEVVSADIFSDEENGLGAKKFYKNNDWLSVQTDVTDTSIYKQKFDLIIFNHCLNFLPEPIEFLNKYIALLKEDGMLVVLGADITGNPSKKEKEVQNFRSHYQTKYAFKINFYDCPGFLSKKLYSILIKSNFRFISYRFSLLGRLRKKLYAEKSGIFVFTKQSKF
jgi:2-polyprenyl-3-methyl-5-hydroxy-6-metoxy-1,4-benzoquinol methylase